MTRDEDLLRMAKESGLTDPDLGDWMTDYGHAEDSIKKFAELVAAAAAAKEREDCAQLLETTDICGDAVMDELAAAIRARGDQ